MTSGPEHLIVEHLRGIRADMSRMADRMTTMGAEITAMRQHLGGFATIQDLDHTEIATIKARFERID